MLQLVQIARRNHSKTLSFLRGTEGIKACQPPFTYITLSDQNKVCKASQRESDKHEIKENVIRGETQKNREMEGREIKKKM